jgi:hypothetical protein
LVCMHAWHSWMHARMHVCDACVGCMHVCVYACVWPMCAMAATATHRSDQT